LGETFIIYSTPLPLFAPKRHLRAKNKGANSGGLDMEKIGYFSGTFHNVVARRWSKLLMNRSRRALVSGICSGAADRWGLCFLAAYRCDECPPRREHPPFELSEVETRSFCWELVK
jgi:hypothetical protein